MEKYFTSAEAMFVRQTMLRHEKMYREQVRELHNLFRVQRTLMSDMKRKMQAVDCTQELLNSGANNSTGRLSKGNQESKVHAKIPRGFDLEQLPEEFFQQESESVTPFKTVKQNGIDEVQLGLGFGCGDLKRPRDVESEARVVKPKVPSLEQIITSNQSSFEKPQYHWLKRDGFGNEAQEDCKPHWLIQGTEPVLLNSRQPEAFTHDFLRQGRETQPKNGLCHSWLQISEESGRVMNSLASGPGRPPVEVPTFLAPLNKNSVEAPLHNVAAYGWRDGRTESHGKQEPTPVIINNCLQETGSWFRQMGYSQYQQQQCPPQQVAVFPGGSCNSSLHSWPSYYPGAAFPAGHSMNGYARISNDAALQSWPQAQANRGQASFASFSVSTPPKPPYKKPPKMVLNNGEILEEKPALFSGCSEDPSRIISGNSYDYFGNGVGITFNKPTTGGFCCSSDGRSREFINFSSVLQGGEQFKACESTQALGTTESATAQIPADFLKSESHGFEHKSVCTEQQLDSAEKRENCSSACKPPIFPEKIDSCRRAESLRSSNRVFKEPAACVRREATEAEEKDCCIQVLRLQGQERESGITASGVKKGVDDDDDVNEIASAAASILLSLAPDKSMTKEASPPSLKKSVTWFANAMPESSEAKTETKPKLSPPPSPELDHFESVTLMLKESEIVNEDDKGSKLLAGAGAAAHNHNTSNKSSNGGKGRRCCSKLQRDFQNEMLPSIASLSRQEIKEDLQVMGGLMRSSREVSRCGSAAAAMDNATNEGGGAVETRRRVSRYLSMARVDNTAKVCASNAHSNSSKKQQQQQQQQALPWLISWGESTRRKRKQRRRRQLHHHQLEHLQLQKVSNS